MGLRTFTFGGKSSSAYSMFITEAATYNVPERAVDILSIPGRNGAYALDQGRFENVEVTYHVVVHKDTNANFQTELTSVKNWLASKVGYQRLTDDYNSNVYRMAIFKGGLETSETFVNGAEFDIVFDCKPQRWLTSGETASAVANNGTLTNPTLFDASPLLEVKGYGTIGLGSESIEVNNTPIGYISLRNRQTVSNTNTFTQTFDASALLSGDEIYLGTCLYEELYKNTSTVSNTSITSTSNTIDASISAPKGTYLQLRIDGADITLTYGTSSSTTISANYSAKISGTTYSKVISLVVSYDGNHTITYTGSNTLSVGSLTMTDQSVRSADVAANSSRPSAGNPMYIDLDIGEAWNEDYGYPVSVNNSVTIPATLPTLPPGTTTITYDNTITSLKIAPRWWQV